MTPTRSNRRRAIGVAAAALTTAGLVTVPPVAASAAPAPSGGAAFGANGESDAVAIRSLTATGLNLAGLRVGPTTSLLDNGGSPIRSTATSSNLGGTVTAAGLTVDSDTQTAPPDHLTPSTRQLLGASLAGVLTTGAGTASDLARYPADPSVCLAAGTALTNNSDTTAGVTLLGGITTAVAPLVSTGPLTTTTTTSLPQVTPGTRGVLSRSSANVAGVSLLGGHATVTVSNTPTLEAFAAGSAAPQRFGYTTAPTASITIGNGAAMALTTADQTYNVAVGTGLNLINATVKARIGTPATTVNTPGHVAGTATAVELTVTATTVAGVSVASTAIGIGQMSVDTSSPTDGVLCANDLPAVAAPVITTPTLNTTVLTATPVIRGTGVAGATVRVTDAGGGTLGTTVVGSDGTWSLTPTAPFANGRVTIGATQTVAGRTSVATSDTFTVAAPAPALAAPTITTPATGSTTTDPSPAIAGRGVAGATVTVVDADGNTVGTAVVAADGTWSVTPATPFANGQVTLRATEATASQTSTATSTSFTEAAPAPVLAAPVVTSPADGSQVTDPRPPITGTGRAGATVTVLDSNGNTVGTAVVAADGTYTVTPAMPFANGPVSLRVSQSLDGQTSAATTVGFTVAAPAPALGVPVISSPTNGSTTTDPSPAISGSGRAGATVTVLDSDGNTVGTAVVAADGTYTVTPRVPFANGPVSLRVTQALGGQMSAAATVGFTVAAPTPAPAAPVISSPVDGSTVTDPSTPITGTGVAGATITVLDSRGNTIGTAVVAADGTYRVTPSVPFANGPVSLRVTQAVNGQSSVAASVGFTVAAPAPALAPPVFTAPGQDSTVTDPSPTITGTGRAGALVTVSRSDGTTLGTAAVAADGTWSLTPQVPFANGVVSLRASQATSTQTSSSASLSFTVAAPAPALPAPVFTAPAAGSTTSNPTPTITGTGRAGAVVTVTTPDGTSLGTAAVAADGTWTLTPTTPFANGSVTLSASEATTTQTSTATSVTFTVAAPAAALAAPVFTAPAQASTTADATPTITGTGVAGDLVTVTDGNGTAVGTASVRVDGTWSLTPTTPFVNGTVTLRASQADSSRTSPQTTVTFTVAAPAPALAAPVIAAPVNNSTTADPTPVVSGTGTAGAVVTVTDGNGGTVGTAVVRADGTWSLTPTAPFGNGTVVLSATQATGGRTSPADSVTFVVAAPAPALAAPVITAPANNSTTTDPTPTISGTGAAGAVVTIRDRDGNVVGTATVAADGTFSVTPGAPFANGPVTVTAGQTLDGRVSSTSSVTFTVAAPAPTLPAPVFTAPVQGSTTTDPSPQIRGTGRAGATVTVVTGDGTSVGSATVAADGTFSLTPASPLPVGAVTLRATQNLAGVTSTAGSVDFVVAAPVAAPDAPVVTSPATGSTVTDTTPTVSGTGVAGATITLLDGNGATIGTAVVDGTGHFAVTPDVPLAPGTVTLGVTQSVGAQTSGTTAVTFTVASPAPALAAPVVTSPADGSTTADPTPTITGSGQPGATVTVRDGTGAVIATTVVGNDGTYAVTPDTPFANGDVTLRVVQTVGDTTSPATSVTFTVAAPAPALAPPVFTDPGQGSTVTDPSPLIRGTGVAGATVTVVRTDGTTVGDAAVATNGTWSLTPATPFANGAVSLRATESTSTATSSAATLDFVVAAPAPTLPPPAFTAPGAGTTVTTATPVIRGTGQANATVTVTDSGGRSLGDAVVAVDGTWQLTPSVPFADGPVTISATEASGGQTSTSVTDSFTVQATAPVPDAPTITAPVADSTTTDSTPDISGTGTVGASVTVIDANTNVLGTTTVGADGTWTVTPTVPFANGPVTVRATQTVDGQTSAAASDRFTVAAPVPVAAPVITAPAQDSTVATGRPPITGTGTAGATITVVDGTGATVGSTVVADDGTWTVTPTTAFRDGPVTVRATQSVGTQTSPAASVDFRVVTPAALAAPTVTSPAPGSTVTDHTPDITGSGSPGAVVTVRDTAGNTIATAAVGNDGRYTATPAASLPDGSITVHVSQALGGQVSSSTSDTFTVATPAPIPAAPTITTPADGSRTSNPRPQVTGTGTAGAAITVTDGNGVVIGSGTVDGTGHYAVTPTMSLATGPATIRVTQTVGGQSSPAASVRITVTAPVTVAPPTITAPAPGSTSVDAQPLITGTGIPGAVVTVREGTRVLGTATVGTNGTWALMPPALADGNHTITATQTTADGTSSASASDTFAVAADPSQMLPAPTITTPVQGSTVTTRTPVITGTGIPGATVTVEAVGQGFQGSTVVGADGRWSLLPSPGFDSGTVTITATQTINGRGSRTSAPDTFAVALPAGQAPGGTLTGLKPTRILDTRDGTGLSAGDKGARRLVVLQVTGTAGIPTDGRVASVVINVTTTHTTADGVITVYPNGSAMPNASSVNTLAGEEQTNLVTVPVGPDGKIVISSTTTTDLVGDVQGWYSTPPYANRLIGRYVALEPARLVDTRIHQGIATAIPANSSSTFQVLGKGGVPTANVGAVVLNITVVHPTARGFVEAYPSGFGRAGVSNVNFEVGDIRANRVVTGVGPDGKVALYNFQGRSDIVVDVTGYFTRGADTGAYFIGVSPRRIVDTRTSTYPGQPTGRLGNDRTVTIQVSGKAGLPGARKASAPTAILANVTAVKAAGPGHMTFYPPNMALPVASDLNYQATDTIANMQIGRLGPVGSENDQAHDGLADLVVDVDGYFTGGTTATPAR